MKERLIGAAVLVALGVWLIPWVLDGPELGGEPEPEALQLPAPANVVPLRTQTIHLDEEREPPTVSPEHAAPDTQATVSAPSRDEAADAPAEPEPVAPEPVDAARSAPAAAPQAVSGGWMVQLGSFSDVENARRLATRVGTYGFRAQVSRFTAGGREMHRVRVGPEPTREQAEAVASSLAAHGFVAQVVSGG